MNIPAPDTLEQNIDNPEPIVDVDVNEDLNVGQDTKDDDNLSLIAKEVINVSPEIMPIIVDKLMDKIMPKVMNKLENGYFLKHAEKTEELAEKMESIVTRVDNLRRADNLRNLIKIDKIRQVQKEKTVRIIGLPENTDVSDYMMDMSKKMNVELDKQDIEHVRIGKQKKNNHTRSWTYKTKSGIGLISHGPKEVGLPPEEKENTRWSKER